MSGADDGILEAALDEAQFAGQIFRVDLDLYEGPLHVLLSLARAQKVDLRRLSILKLAEQYLAFVAAARSGRIDLAADYLVMAAWLAWLKSRLLLPQPERATAEDEPEDMAANLAWRLRRLDAMRRAADALTSRPQLRLDVFARGAPEPVSVTETALWEADLIDLIRAYAAQRNRAAPKSHSVKPWPVYSLEAARQRLESRIQGTTDWTDLGVFAPPAAAFRADPPSARSRYASLMSASLELARQGRLALRQKAPGDGLYVKARTGDDEAPATSGTLRP